MQRIIDFGEIENESQFQIGVYRLDRRDARPAHGHVAVHVHVKRGRGRLAVN